MGLGTGNMVMRERNVIPDFMVYVEDMTGQRAKDREQVIQKIRRCKAFWFFLANCSFPCVWISVLNQLMEWRSYHMFWSLNSLLSFYAYSCHIFCLAFH